MEEKQIEKMWKMYILNIVLQEVKPLKLREKIYWRIVEFMEKKIPEDSVVLTREEYKTIYNDERASYYRAENLAVENDLLNRKLLDARKETAREIFACVESTLKNEEPSYTIEIDVIRNLLKELAKKYGVGVE